MAKLITRCLYPVAGFGTRFLPATKVVAKEMLPIVDTPLIQYGVEEAYFAGINNMVMVTSRQKKVIEDHFDKSLDLNKVIKNKEDKLKLLAPLNNLIKNCSFSFIRQKKMAGLGNAIHTGEPIIDDNPFMVILPDDLCINENGDNVTSQMVKLYEKYKCSIVAIEEVDPNEVNKYGVISGNEIEKDIYQIEDMIEKPDIDKAPTNLAIIGRYILTPDIFKIIEKTKKGKGGEIQITDALLTQAKNQRVLAYKFEGRRFDCGSVKGFIDASNYFYNKRL